MMTANVASERCRPLHLRFQTRKKFHHSTREHLDVGTHTLACHRCKIQGFAFLLSFALQPEVPPLGELSGPRLHFLQPTCGWHDFHDARLYALIADFGYVAEGVAEVFGGREVDWRLRDLQDNSALFCERLSQRLRRVSSKRI
jgi:hypothetical protein